MREIMLILHFIGLAMGLGTSFGFMFLGIASAKMEKGDRMKFQLNAMALSRMGHIGLALLVISGIVLMTPFWKVLLSSPVLIAKLVLVLVLGALIGKITSIGKKAIQGNPEEQLNKMQPLGKMALLTGLAIVVLAVYFFH
ncbi:MAG TPA: hypothetical protein DIW47_10205 [Bacteroidetes bacterium]|nr:hypothetical protein [Bacteroidota bacterium]